MLDVEPCTLGFIPKRPQPYPAQASVHSGGLRGKTHGSRARYADHHAVHCEWAALRRNEMGPLLVVSRDFCKDFKHRIGTGINLSSWQALPTTNNPDASSYRAYAGQRVCVEERTVSAAR